MNNIELKEYIREIQDFPQPGIGFKDITTLLKDPEAFYFAISALVDLYREEDIDLIVGPEARGFIVGAPVAYALKKGFVPVRKPGKLPAPTKSIEYELEYGTNTIELHLDAIKPGQKVLVLDDLLATGGTSLATAQLIESLGGIVVGFGFIMELTFLTGREVLKDYDIKTLLEY